MPKVETEFGGLLKGSDVVAAGKQMVGGIILGVRAAVAGINAPYVIDFDTDILPGISSWPCNKTEARKLAEKISSLTENWTGWGIALAVENKNNPKLAFQKGVPEYLVPGLVVAAVMKPAEAAKKRKTTPKHTAATVAKAAAPAASSVDWDKVPF